jgi:hypothetical protein
MIVFNRRERPHIVLGKDGVTPVALTNGVGIVGNEGRGDAYRTFLQPLATTRG